MNSLRLRSICARLSDASSDTRRPVEESVSRIARSRAPLASVGSTAAKRRSSSSRSRTSTVRSGIFESSIFSGANVSMSFFVRYLRRARSEITW